jgi:hypothetical protein
MIYNKEEHIIVHKKLHEALDELIADFMDNTGKLASQTSVIELMRWSYVQTINPVEKER